MHKFMEGNHICSVTQLFEIKIDRLIVMPDFPYRLLEEWVLLRDRFNFLGEN